MNENKAVIKLKNGVSLAVGSDKVYIDKNEVAYIIYSENVKVRSFPNDFLEISEKTNAGH